MNSKLNSDTDDMLAEVVLCGNPVCDLNDFKIVMRDIRLQGFYRFADVLEEAVTGIVVTYCDCDSDCDCCGW